MRQKYSRSQGFPGPGGCRVGGETGERKGGEQGRETEGETVRAEREGRVAGLAGEEPRSWGRAVGAVRENEPFRLAKGTRIISQHPPCSEAQSPAPPTHLPVKPQQLSPEAGCPVAQSSLSRAGGDWGRGWSVPLPAARLLPCPGQAPLPRCPALHPLLQSVRGPVPQAAHHLIPLELLSV